MVGLPPGGVCPGVICIQGESASRGVCIQGDLYPRGSASRGVCIQRRGLHPRGICFQGGWASPPLDTMVYGQWAGGTHPTGLYSCLISSFSVLLSLYILIWVKKKNSPYNDDFKIEKTKIAIGSEPSFKSNLCPSVGLRNKWIRKTCRIRIKNYCVRENDAVYFHTFKLLT